MLDRDHEDSAGCPPVGEENNMKKLPDVRHIIGMYSILHMIIIKTVILYK